MNGLRRLASGHAIDLSSPGLRDVKIGDSTISYTVSGDGGVEIGSLRTPQSKRGQGSARAAMQEFLAEADRAGATVKLGASPLDSRTRLDRLVGFYRSVGFEPTGRRINIAGEPEMIRPPMRQAGAATPAALAATAAVAGTGAALETQRRREAPEQNLLSWLADSAKARWGRTIDDVRQTASAIADVAPDVYNGFSRLPYRVLGAPVDLADTVARPLAGIAGIPMAEPSQTYGTSDWMIAQAQEAGLLPPSSGSTAEMAGDVLGGLIDVSPVTEAAMVSRAMRGPRADIFAGQKAATADLAAMRRAEERLAGGDDPAKVWADEGWFRGPDGQMRFEIDDSQATVSEGGRSAVMFAGIRPQDKVLQHPAFYEAYPQARDVRISNEPNLRGGAYLDPENNTMAFDFGSYRPGQREDVSSMLHENQHMAQLAEGFARGGDPAEFTQQADAEFARDVLHFARNVRSLAEQNPNKTPRALANQIIKEYKDNDLEEFVPSPNVIEYALRDTIVRPEMYPGSNELNQLQELVSLYGLDRRVTPYRSKEIYERLLGEAEARAVQARIPLSAAERRARYPLEDYDVPLEQLIIRR